MAASVTLTKIQFTNAQSVIRVRFGKKEYEFNNLAHLQAIVEPFLRREVLEMIALAILMERQPNIGNPGAIEGHSINVDLSANNWGTLT